MRISDWSSDVCSSDLRTPPEKFPECLDYIRSQPEYDGRPISMFFAIEMLNVGAHHEILDDPRSTGTRSTQQIIDQIGWLKDLGISYTIMPMPPGLYGLGEYIYCFRCVVTEIIPNIGYTVKITFSIV